MRSPMLLALLASACATNAAEPPVVTRPPAPQASTETHFKQLTQLTFGGENAEAYWRFDGTGASLQRRAGDSVCDSIFTLNLFDQSHQLLANPELKQISSGKGATTCSHFFPDGKELLYASTHLGGEACPPKPDMSQGYVWALYSSYDIFKANADGSGLTRLTDTPGYDAEGTVCSKDGSILFTSVRDGDIELYRMDKDGKNVKRLTNAPGYDGGGFFNADCSKIVWRASRPHPGPELDSFKSLLAQGLVRPTKLELYVADADGGNARQVTYLDAASFAPFWYPNRDRIIFSSNYGDPKGREFDLWAINADGSQLERVTHSPGFDGFPMFSPDGQYLLFSSNRATAEGASDTNLFLARWDDHAPTVAESGAAERTLADAAWLADPAREGRGVGTPGLAAAGSFIEQRFKDLGLEPVGEAGGYRVGFEVTTAVKSGKSALKIATTELAPDAFVPMGFSAQGSVKAPAVLAGYGLREAELGIDEWKGLDVRGKVVVVRRFVPENPKLSTAELQRSAGDLRKKAFVAKSLGAKAVLIVDWPMISASPAGASPHGAAPAGGATPSAATAQPSAVSAGHPQPSGASGATPSAATAQPSAVSAGHPQPSAAGAPALPAGHGSAAVPKTAPELPTEAALPSLQPAGPGDAGIPVLAVKRAAFQPVWKRLEAKQPVDVALTVALEYERSPAFNVVGRIRAGNKQSEGAIIVGAHYDHLGYGGHDSLAPDQHVPHLGADDNASGTATILELARELSARKQTLTRDVVVAAFSGEEMGILGSAALVASKPAWLNGAQAMLNFDMVGRMRSNTIDVLGIQTAPEWQNLVQNACDKARVVCKASGDGYGPSDQMSFYTVGLPVLHFFTGAHADYHKPSDTAALLNGSGMARVAELATELVVSAQSTALSYQKLPMPIGRGDARSWNASLGTVPDYGGPPSGTKGVLLSDVRPEGGADKAGMHRGDIIVKLGKFDVGSVEDLMFVLMQAKPGETVTAVVMRQGREVKMQTTFQEGRRR